jgi:P4 family phage/plasmid primase-like protien
MEPPAKKPRLEEKKLTLTRFDFKREDTIREMTEYPDTWMELRSINENQFEEFGITTDEWYKSYCQGHVLLMSDNRWTDYQIGNGILPSKQWFHMGLNDHVQSLMMEADTGLAKLFCIYEGHNIKTIDDNGSGYYWNESSLLWEELGKNKLRKRIGDFFEVLFSEQVQWAHSNLEHLRMIRNTFVGERGEQQHEGYKAHEQWKKQFEKNLESFENEYDQTCKILKQIGSWNGLGGIFQMICADAYDKEFEDVVNMSSTELPTKGGNVIDFKTLQVRPRCHSDYWSYELNTEYIPIPSVMPTSEIDLQKVEEHLQKVEERRFVVGMLKTFCNDDIEMLNYLQRLTGVMCTREAVIMKKIFIFVGKTDTGKSETFKWIRNVLIDQRNYVTIGEEVLMQTGKERKGRCTTELMNMPRARACVASELSPNCVFNNTLVKRLTGGDPQTIRGLRKAETQFVMKAVLALFTNDIPQLSLLEEAMNRRVVVIPCEGKIVKNEENNQKCIRMLSQDSQNALFSWMAEGAKLFLENHSLGQIPRVIEEASNNYVEQQDSASEWVREMCTTGVKHDPKIVLKKSTVKNMKHSTPRGDLYDPYAEWCEETGKPAMNKGDFLKQMMKIQSNFGFLFKKSGTVKVFGLRIDTKGDCDNESKN